MKDTRLRPTDRCSLLLLAVSAPVLAAPPLASAAVPAAAPPACTAPAALPPALAPWSRPVPTTSAATIAPGQAALVSLIAAPAFAAPPGRLPRPDTLGAAVPLTVATAGRYRVLLSAPAWIDLIAGSGKPLMSTGHDHGPACSGIAKIVAFDLPPGRYRLQISGATVPTAKVLLLAGGL